jgi:hypothetical protein
MATKKYTVPWITGVTRKTLRSKVAKHYKAYHAIDDMGLAKNDRQMVDWATALIEELYPAAVHVVPEVGNSDPA